MVPRGGGARAGLFHQYVLMKKPRLAGAHEVAGNLGQDPRKPRFSKFGNSLPADVIVKETAVRPLGGVIVGPITGAPQVAIHTFFNAGKGLRGNHPCEDDKTVSLVILNLLQGHQGHVSIVGPEVVGSPIS